MRIARIHPRLINRSQRCETVTRNPRILLKPEVITSNTIRHQCLPETRYKTFAYSRPQFRASTRSLNVLTQNVREGSSTRRSRTAQAQISPHWNLAGLTRIGFTSYPIPRHQHPQTPHAKHDDQKQTDESATDTSTDKHAATPQDTQHTQTGQEPSHNQRKKPSHIVLT